MDWIITTLLGFVGGFVAWVVTNFVAQPVLKFLTLRDEAAEALSMFRNVGPIDDELSTREAMSIAQRELRKIAIRLNAFYQTDLGVAIPLLSYLGYDVREAAQQMFRVANTISTFGQERADAQRGIRAALKLRDPDAPGVAKIP